MTRHLPWIVVVALSFTACGGGKPKLEWPEDDLPAEEDYKARRDPREEPKPEPKKELEPEPEKSRDPSEIPDPTFTEGMSVEEAIAAVPRDLPFVAMEEEFLGDPFKGPDWFKPCTPKPRQKVKIRVAVWLGRPVGVDIKVKPKDDELAACMRKAVEKLSWRERVRSLNTVRFEL